MNDYDVLSLTKTLVDIPSVSRQGNAEVSDYLETWLREAGFEQIERLEYNDENDVLKVNLIAKLGEGDGGLAFCSHSDTVPGQESDWRPWDAEIRDGRLYGRGSCDMKGPLAATMVAAATVDRTKLKTPLYIVVTADEELGLLGAQHVDKHSQMLRQVKPKYGVIAEPTRLIPVYGHKGFTQISVTAKGFAAHTSSGKGVSANFKIAPFLAEMAELAELLVTDSSYMNDSFDPPSNGFNMVLNDGGTAANVTAAKTTASITYRPMPNTRSEELRQMILAKAEKYGLEATSLAEDPFYTAPESELVQVSSDATGVADPEVVPYGTDGIYLQNHFEQMVVLGPGDINVAHTVGESIPVGELTRSVDIYKQIIQSLCM